MRAHPQYWRQMGISRDPAEIADPANAPYLYTDARGEKFLDWLNPNHQLEKWGERICLLLHGAQEEKEEYYRQYYYSLLSRRLGLGPDAVDQEPAATQPQQGALTELLQALRDMKSHVERLIRQKNILARAAAAGGCPATSQLGCSLRESPAASRDAGRCMACWLEHAEAGDSEAIL